MNDFDQELNQRLELLRQQELYRELREVDSPQSTRIELSQRTFLNFSSNDYLGLANHPALKNAAIKAVEKFGAGAGASRLISGSLRPFHELESGLAFFKGTEAALSFSSGYAAALGTISALLDKQDVLVIDKLSHASLIDAARLCGAKLRVFAHNDLNDLESILQWAVKRSTGTSRTARILIVTESVFSMDGDHAPLRDLVALKSKYGAWLMVDEAHATGIYGKHARGLAEEAGVSEAIEVQMGTLGKAVGAAGGYICGSRELIDLLINRARAFIFSTAPFPAAAAAAAAGLEMIQSAEGEQRRALLWRRVDELTSKLFEAGPVHRSAIMPIILGHQAKAVHAATTLRSRGLFVPAIRYPTVPRGSARLRVTLTAEHTSADIDQLAMELQALGVAPVNSLTHG